VEGPLKAPPPPGPRPAESHHPGLCADCRHARPVTTTRGSTFWRCGRSDADTASGASPTYPKYPRLPVITCLGFEQLSAKERDRSGD
jgi:hypothetical protein